ncbi:pseudouridine synthase, partial [Sphingomonas sp. RP10(2022)]
MAQPPETQTGANAGDRIAKLLARAGVASRREIERMIAEGRVAVDGTVLDTPATILKSLRGVTVDGQPVALPEPTRLFLYHKPTGLLVTERDPKGRPTIYDRLPHDLPRLVPVGRLDLNTEGLLLLTTDGGFKRQLELPSTGVERSYRARAYGNVTQQQLEELAEGVEIEGIRYGSIDANIERRTGANVWIEITITEGKNREVRRVLEYLGLQVSRLIRTRYGPFVLGDLPAGGVGEVKQHEVVAFRRTLKGGAPDEPIVQAPHDGFRTAPTVDRSARARPRPVETPSKAPRAAPAPGARAAAPARDGFRSAPTVDRGARARTHAAEAPRTEDRPARTPAPAGGRRAPRRGDSSATTDRPARAESAGARQDGRKTFQPRTDRGGDREPSRSRFGDDRRPDRTEAKPAGARPPRPGARPQRRDDAVPRMNVPTGGSAIKPWEKADDRQPGRSSERSRSGDAKPAGSRPARSGARPPRDGDAPRGG